MKFARDEPLARFVEQIAGRFSRRRKVYQFVTDLPKLSGKCIVNGYGFGENALMHHRRSKLLTVSLNREIQ